MENYLFKADKLIAFCDTPQKLNKLYLKQFAKISTYDEEEECTIEPTHANGYTFELNINSYLRELKNIKFVKDEFAADIDSKDKVF